MIKLDWEKVNGLIPAIIQDHQTLQVLMLGYMNKEALEISQSTGLATFFSRTRQKLWTKGETSGNNLKIKKSNSPNGPAKRVKIKGIIKIM